jgi:cell division protein FtsQ
VASQVEPRIVERRQTVERMARRRRHRVFAVFGLVLALVAAGIGATMSPLLDIDRITVVGEQRLSADELIEASGLQRGERLVDVDVNAARRSLMALPLVASARVVRDWPDAVRITLTEEQPSLTVQAADRTVLVSRTGRVLETLSEPAPGHPVLVLDVPLDLTGTRSATGDGVVGAVISEPLRHATAVFERISDDLRGELALARLSDAGTLSFELSDGAVVEFGPPEDVAAKLLAVQAVLSQVQRTCMATLDVREPSRPAVSRQDGCAGLRQVGTPAASTTSDDSSATTAGGSTTSRAGSGTGDR